MADAAADNYPIALSDGPAWPADRIIPDGYSELRTRLGRVIHTVER